MNCHICQFPQHHHGIFCIECGASLIDITPPLAVYRDFGKIHLVLAINNTIDDAEVLIKSVRLGSMTSNASVYLPCRKEIYEIGFENNNPGNNTVTLAAGFITLGKNGREFVISLGDIKVCSMPQIRCMENLKKSDDSYVIKLSKAENYCAKLTLQLENSSYVHITGLRLELYGDPPPFHTNIPRTVNVETFSENPIILDADNVTKDVYFCFEEFSKIMESLKDSGFIPRYRITRIIRFNNEEFIVEPIGAPGPLVFTEYRIPSIELGIWRSTHSGFIYLVHNREYQRDLGGTRKDKNYIINGPISDYLDDIKLRKYTPPDKPRLEGELESLSRNNINVNIPIGLKRRRNFAIFQNYTGDEGIRIHVINNKFDVSLELSENVGENRNYLEDNILLINPVNGKYAKLGENLVLDYSQKQSVFVISFFIPDTDRVVPGLMKFNLFIKLKTRIKPYKTVEEIRYVINAHFYKRLINTSNIAIDFGTSRSCIVGPKIWQGKLASTTDSYRLDYYHPQLIRETSNTIPTALGYNWEESRPEPFIPDIGETFISENFGTNKIIKNFKLSLINEMENRETNLPIPIKPTQVTAQYFSCLFELMEIFYEDHDCFYTQFTSVIATAPVSFIPELRREVTEAVTRRLEQRYGDFSFTIDIDEPHAVYIYSRQHNLIDIPTGSECLIGILDVGGGTTDTAIIVCGGAANKTLVGTGGSCNVGGHVFDRWLAWRLTLPPTISNTMLAAQINPHSGPGEINELEDDRVEKMVQDEFLYYSFANLKRYLSIGRCEELEPGFTEAFGDIHNLLRESACTDDNAEEILDKIAKITSNQRFNEAYESRENSSGDWNNAATIYHHLLLPFYCFLYRQLELIMHDTLVETFDNLSKLGLRCEMDLSMILAGNCSKIRYLPDIVRDILKKSACKFSDITSTSVKNLLAAKESVAFGAYLEPQIYSGELIKRTNPPFTLFIHTERSNIPDEQQNNLVESIDDKHFGIPLFNEGCFSDANADEANARIFPLKEPFFIPRWKNISLARKIGIDIIHYKYAYEELSKEPKWILYYLNNRNSLNIYTFNNKEDLKHLNIKVGSLPDE